MYPHARGLTLIEMIIVLAVCALLFGLAVPGLGSIIIKNESEVLVNEMVRLMAYARKNGGYGEYHDYLQHGKTPHRVRTGNGYGFVCVLHHMYCLYPAAGLTLTLLVFSRN